MKRILRSIDKSRFYNQFGQIGVSPLPPPPLNQVYYIFHQSFLQLTELMNPKQTIYGKYHTILRIRFLIRHTLIIKSSFADNFVKNLLKIMLFTQHMA